MSGNSALNVTDAQKSHLASTGGLVSGLSLEPETVPYSLDYSAAQQELLLSMTKPEDNQS